MLSFVGPCVLVALGLFQLWSLHRIAVGKSLLGGDRPLPADALAGVTAPYLFWMDAFFALGSGIAVIFTWSTPGLAAAYAAACVLMSLLALRRRSHRQQAASVPPANLDSASASGDRRRWPARVYGVTGLLFVVAYYVLTSIGNDDPNEVVTVVGLACFAVAALFLGIAAWKAFVSTTEKSARDYLDGH